MKIESITVKQSFGPAWTNTNNHVDIGKYSGIYRGYNLEFKDSNDAVEYADIVLTAGDLDTENPDFQMTFQSYRHVGYQFTGRAMFRGYFTGDYDQSTDTLQPMGDKEFEIFYNDVMKGDIYY